MHVKDKSTTKKKKKTNIHVKHLRLNIIFYYDVNDSLSEIKTRIINEDANLTSNVLLIVNILLVINNSRHELKN